MLGQVAKVLRNWACTTDTECALFCWVCPALQLGVLVQHREACRSVLTFLNRLLDPSTALAKLQEQHVLQQRQLLGGTGLDGAAAGTALLQSQLDRVGPNLSRMLMGAVVGALPYSRVGDIAPVIQVGCLLLLCLAKDFSVCICSAAVFGMGCPVHQMAGMTQLAI
jgi:hypothetical protein